MSTRVSTSTRMWIFRLGSSYEKLRFISRYQEVRFYAPKNSLKLNLSIEYDEDDEELKVMGPSNGCLPCYKPHWDYVQNGSGQASMDSSRQLVSDSYHEIYLLVWKVRASLDKAIIWSDIVQSMVWILQRNAHWSAVKFRNVASGGNNVMYIKN